MLASCNLTMQLVALSMIAFNIHLHFINLWDLKSIFDCLLILGAMLIFIIVYGAKSVGNSALMIRCYAWNMNINSNVEEIEV